jgi:hypothetical protein
MPCRAHVSSMNRSASVEFVAQQLTSYGGLELITRQFRTMNVMSRLRRALAAVPSDYGSARLALLVLGLFYVGSRRLEHVRGVGSPEIGYDRSPMGSGDARRSIAPGLYDQPITRSIAARLEHLAPELRVLDPLDPHYAPEAVARLLYLRLVHALKSVGGDHGALDQLILANRVLDLLRVSAPHGGASEDDDLVPPGQRLLAVLESRDGPGAPRAPLRPQIPLSTSFETSVGDAAGVRYAC